MKRSASSKATKLIPHASPFHSSVTLFEADDALGQSIPRRSKRVKLEENIPSAVPDIEDTITTQGHGSSSHLNKPKLQSKGSGSPRKPKPIQQTLKTPHPAPPRWRDVYDAIKEMRSHIIAPVDTMGCDQAQLKEVEPKVSPHLLVTNSLLNEMQNQRFSTLVSLMLSSQTKDEVTDAAVSKLREAVGGSLSVDAILAADEGAISEAIAKVGFWRRKTQSVHLFIMIITPIYHIVLCRYLKQTAQKLRDDFDSDVPKTVDDLCSLPGVGPKMAFLALQIAWNLFAELIFYCLP
jgi:endonuclease-3